MNSTSELLNPLDQPPTHDFSEYISIGYQIAFLIAGVPLNLQALYAITISFQSVSTMPRFILLKLNLIITDLLILLIYTVSEICWASTFVWYGGPFLCKLIKFLHVIAFVSHANIVVSIAIDRALTVAQMKQFHQKNQHQRRVRLMLLISWCLAIATSIPQFFVWIVVTPFPDWTQCTTTWHYEKFLHGEDESSVWETAYSISHLLVVFYCPAAIISSAYIYVLISYKTNLREMNCPASSNMDNDVNLELSRENSGTYIHLAGLICQHRLSNSVANQESKRQCNANRRTKMVGKTIIIALAYVICFAPYNVCALWRQLALDSWRENNFEAIIGFLDGPIILNAVIDPILYRVH